MPRKTPQQKKKESYARDRRNVYGEGDKSSRKALRRRKRKPNRAERRAVHQTVRGPADAEDIAHLDAIDVAATRPRSRRQRWQKVPDKPLGEVVEERIRRRVRMGIDDPQSADEKIGRIRRRK